MKRVLAACFLQTLHFQLKEEMPHDEAVRMDRLEVKRYKEALDRRHTKQKIDSEIEQPDGSVILKIRKQNLSQPVGKYLDRSVSRRDCPGGFVRG